MRGSVCLEFHSDCEADIPLATHKTRHYYDHDHTQLPSKDNKQETDYRQINAYIPILSTSGLDIQIYCTHVVFVKFCAFYTLLLLR